MSLMPFTDPNAAASANASRGMSNLSNFIYQQQVQKPQAQAQTAAIQSQTAAIQSQTTAQKMANVSQRTQQLLQSAEYGDADGVDAAVAAANAPTTVSPSVDPNTAPAPNPASSGGSPMSGASPVSANTLPPNSAADSATASPLPSPKLNTDWTPGAFPGSAPLGPPSDNPVGIPLTNPPRATAPLPPVAPVSAAPPVVAAPPVEKPWSIRDNLTTPFVKLPPAAQDYMIAQERKRFAAEGIPISRSQLVDNYNQRQSAYYPTLPQWITNMTPLSADMGGIKFINSDAAASINQGGGDNPPFIFDPTTGKNVANPDHRTPDQISTGLDRISTLNQSQVLADAAKQGIEDFPSVVGASGGGKAGSLVRFGQELAGNAKARQAQKAVQDFLGSQTLFALNDLKAGRINQTTYEGEIEALPKENWPAASWDEYFKKQFQPKQDANMASAKVGVPKSSLPQQTLGDVGVATPVTTPGAPSPDGPILTPAQAAAAKPGTRYRRSDTGQLMQR
jgi:hypothetical protein